MASPGNPTFGPNFSGSRNIIALERTLGMPAEGPKCVNIPLDFTATDNIPVDLSTQAWQGKISMIQTVYVDMGTSGVEMTITASGTNQKIRTKPNTQGYYPLLCANPPQVTFTCPGGSNDIIATLLNFPISPGQWSV